MNSPQYHCGSTGRRQAVLDQDQLNGIDYLEVASADQLKLKIVFLHKLPKAGVTGTVPDDPARELKAANIRIDGGVRVTGITVTQIDGIAGKVLTLTVSARGDFSTYTLQLVTSPTDDTPFAGYDPRLSRVEFSFKAGCPNDFDCQIVDSCPPPAAPDPGLDYLAKDYSSFRRLMLDRLSVLMPDWRERNAADGLVALVELLAYTGDHLSYYQDAVATEAYLGTARKRVSLRRHARLLDYRVGEGCNSRTFIALTAGADADGKILPGPDAAAGTAGSLLATRLTGEAALLTFTGATAADRETEKNSLLTRLDRASPGDEPTFFETLHDLTLVAAHNEIAFHTWSDSECCLPRGAIRATLDNSDGKLALKPGDLLLLEETRSPITGLAADADPTHRHVVRIETVSLGPTVTDPLTGRRIAEVSWRSEDALPFPLCISARLTNSDGNVVLETVAVARGNIVLADHGRTVTDLNLDPPEVPVSGAFRPALPLADVTFAAPFELGTSSIDPVTALSTVDPALNALLFDASAAVPAVRLDDGSEPWFPRADLLSSDRFAPEFVVEMDNDGVGRLRFGDGVLGQRPAAGTAFALSFRVGNGIAGNVGADAIRHVFAPVTSLPKGSIGAVRNPIPARGGTAPESMEQVRQFAPQAFRRQERAVTEADWAEVSQRFPGVQKAAARFRWTGSWHTVFVTIDRVGGVPAARDPRFKQALRDHLERYRVAGYDLEITDPVHVPLDLAFTVCVKPGYFRSRVLTGLKTAFGTGSNADGSPGFFHPDNFTFGQALHLSRIYATAMAVAGVASVQVTRFQRWGRVANNELQNAVIAAADLEILRLDNDPSLPENGLIEFELHGGL